MDFLKNITDKIKEILSLVTGLSKIIYENSYKYLLLIWTLFSIIFFLQTNYEICVKKYIDEFLIIRIFFMNIFLLLVFHIIFHLVVFKDNEQVMEDKENSKFVPKMMNEDKLYFLIMPIYALWIYAFSKIIKYAYNYFILQVSISVVNFIIWFFIFELFLWLWFKFKHKAKKTWDLSLTLFIVLVTSIHIFWASIFLPFTKVVLNIGECVSHEIMIEKINIK